MKDANRELVWKGLELSVYRQVLTVEGQRLTLEHVVRADGTRTIAIDDKKQLLLTNEFRRELGERDWRLPGGKLDAMNEPLVDAAKREFEEETGYTARHWQYLWSSTPHATVRYQRHFFLATGLVQGTPNTSIAEDIRVCWVPLSEAVKMALEGKIREEISALSILRLVYQMNKELLSLDLDLPL